MRKPWSYQQINIVFNTTLNLLHAKQLQYIGYCVSWSKNEWDMWKVHMEIVEDYSGKFKELCGDFQTTLLMNVIQLYEYLEF